MKKTQRKTDNSSNAKIKDKKDIKKGSQTTIDLQYPKELPFWIVALIFFILTLIFFWDHIVGKAFFWDDFVRYVYPMQSFSAKEFASGNIPFWNPYIFAGMPFLADIQVGFFYPFNRILGLFINPNGHLSVWWLQFVIIIHFFIAQISMYLLSRSFKVSSYSAILSAIAYTFSLFMVCHAFHPMIIYHLAWFPLVIMFFIKALNERKYIFGIFSGLILGFSLLSGHPQIALYEFLFLGILGIWYFICEIKKKIIQGKNIISYVLVLIIPFVISIGIFFIQYLPSQTLASLSQRDEIKYAKASPSLKEEIKWEKATEGSLKFGQLFTSVVPNLFGSVDGTNEKKMAPFHLPFKFVKVEETGNKNNLYKIVAEEQIQNHFYWETAYYFGIATLILSIFGAIIGFRIRHVAFFIFISLFSLLFALGENGLLYNLFFKLPFFSTFRNPSRMLFLLVLSASILAGFGFDQLLKSRMSKKVLIRLLIISGIVLLITILASTKILHGIFIDEEMLNAKILSNIQTAVSSYGITSLFFVSCVSVLFYIIYRVNSSKSIQILSILLFFILFIDLYIAGNTFNKSPINPEKKYEIPTELKSLLKSNPPQDIFRVNMRKYKDGATILKAMEDNQGMLDGIMLIEGYNPLILDRVAPTLPSFDDYLDISNVKYEITQQGFLERKSYFPRAWLVHKARRYNSDEILKRLKKDTIDLRNEAVFEEDIPINLSENNSDSLYDEVKFTEYSNNYFKCKVKNSENAILCFSEIWYPDWKAYVNGKEIKVNRINYSYRGLALPKGEFEVEMKYESSEFNLGSIIALTIIGLSIVGIIFYYIPKNKLWKK